jgi:integrase
LKSAKQEQEKAQAAREAEEANTFLRVAKDWRETWQTHVAPTTNKSIWGNLERNIFPVLGDMHIVEAADSVLDALQKIEAAGKGDTLRKARGAISLIFNHAKNNLKIKIENPTKSFDRYTFKKCETTNYPAILDLPGIAKLLRDIDAYHGTLPGVEAALRLAPLLFQRIGELRAMRLGRSQP